MSTPTENAADAAVHRIIRELDAIHAKDLSWSCRAWLVEALHVRACRAENRQRLGGGRAIKRESTR